MLLEAEIHKQARRTRNNIDVTSRFLLAGRCAYPLGTRNVHETSSRRKWRLGDRNSRSHRIYFAANETYPLPVLDRLGSCLSST